MIVTGLDMSSIDKSAIHADEGPVSRGVGYVESRRATQPE
jgi:hypothetical protein